MKKSIEDQIALVEEELKVAMLSSNTESLNKILSSDLVFTNHLGQLVGKEDDISIHRSGTLNISEIEFSEQKILVISDDSAVVSVRAKITGEYKAQPANGDFRFTRVWSLSGSNDWQVVAVHSGIIA